MEPTDRTSQWHQLGNTTEVSTAPELGGGAPVYELLQLRTLVRIGSGCSIRHEPADHVSRSSPCAVAGGDEGSSSSRTSGASLQYL